MADPMTREAMIERLAHYVAERRKMRGLDPDVVHSVHSPMDEPRHAELRLSDLDAVLAALRAAPPEPDLSPGTAANEVANIEGHIEALLPDDYLASIGADVQAPNHKRQLHHRCMRIFDDLADRLKAAPPADTGAPPALVALVQEWQEAQAEWNNEETHATANRLGRAELALKDWTPAAPTGDTPPTKEGR